jgi:hypothetical protein
MSKVQFKPIKPRTISFWIRGTSPLIQHAWSDKGLKMLRMSAAERKKQPKTARDPEGEASSACYVTANGEHGIPLTAFKAALISAAHKDYGLEKTVVMKAFFIPSDDPNRVVPMESDPPIVREDVVRIGQNQTDIRYRPEFSDWRVNIVAEVDTELLTSDDIVALVNRAGFSVGIGEWRPEKGGEYGRFELDTTEPVEER